MSATIAFSDMLHAFEVELLMFHDPHAAKGILVGVLGVLAVHYGYSR